MKKAIKGMIGMSIIAPLSGSVLNSIGNSGMATGLRHATQSFVSLGVLGHSAKLAKGFFKK